MFLLSVMFCQPVLAADISLEVNQQGIAPPEIYLEQDTTMVPATFFARISGCSITWLAENKLEIAGEGNMLVLTPGEKEMLFAGEAYALPVAPVMKESELFIPLRMVSEPFGFGVHWNAEQRIASLERVQMREGKTAQDLLIQANQVSQKFNTYTFDGVMEMAFNIEADGDLPLDQPLEMTSQFKGSIQNEPLQVYMQQQMSVPGEQMPEDLGEYLLMETYMNADKMYVKAPGEEWSYMDLPFPAEFLKEQQDIQADPLKAVAQMNEMGMVCNFSDDVNLNGEDYYVINTLIDPDKFRETAGKMLEQMLPTINLGPETPDLSVLMQHLFEKMDMDYAMTAYINKNTALAEVIKFTSKTTLNLSISDFAFLDTNLEGEMPESIPENMQIEIAQKGQFNITSVDQPFTPPDITEAKELSLEGFN